MEDKTKKSISQNIKRLLMFKALNEIQDIVNSVKEQDKKNKIQALIIITLGVIVLSYIIYSLGSNKRPKKININLNTSNIEQITYKPYFNKQNYYIFKRIIKS